MNPHFIFNSLNSIREMILNNENKEASHFLSKFAHLIRITLDESGAAFVSLRSTINYLQRYIEMEQIRNTNFDCRINTSDELDTDETLLPPMLIQPFTENAIWHGASGNNKNISICIDFKKLNNQLICTIDDNGTGIESSLQKRLANPNLHKPMGISNIRQRIQLLNEKYGLKSSIVVEDKSKIPGCKESGTRVTIQLPLEITIHE
jgi:LytS/YehU family sensor histidine kinase